MPQNTNLNVSPYFDDFNESKNYQKVLFKPGFPVQARELTTLQSILQNQVEKFGRHFFKEGSMIIPGGTIYDDRYFAVKIDPNFLNIPVNVYTKILADSKIEIVGEISGVQATVVNRITASESIDGFDTLYVKYSKSGSDGVSKVFLDGENLITLSSFNYLNASVSANSQFAKTIITGSTSTASSFSVNEGVYFIRGFFVKTAASTVILDQYGNSPSYRVGFLIKEENVSPSSVNSDLYDNAKGFANEAAPGADRFKLSTSLHKKLLTDKNDIDFVELLRVENGIVREMVTRTEYNIFAQELARRTYDESGDYYIKPFSIDVRESLNDRLGNRGIYFDTQETQNGNTPSDDVISLQVSSGKAYVRGYEVEKRSTSSIDILKPRTTKLVENQSVPIRIGNSMEVTNIVGSPVIGFGNNSSLKLLNRRLKDQRESDINSTVIGDLRAYDYNQKVGLGSISSFELKFYDLQLFTKLTLVRNIPSGTTFSAGSHIKGKFSGSVGYLVSNVTNSGIMTLRDLTGEFQINEPIIINGIESGNSIKEITDNSFEDIKVVHSSEGIGTGDTIFAAETVLNQTKQLFKTAAEFNIVTPDPVTGLSTITCGAIRDFRSVVKPNDVVSYITSANTSPAFNRVDSVGAAGTSIIVGPITTVPGICNGEVLGSTPNDLSLVFPSIKTSDDPGFRVKLSDRYISSINVLDSSYITRKQITKTNFVNNTAVFDINDISGDNDNLFFEPFTISNYVLEIDTSAAGDNGKVEKLTESMVTVSTNLKTVTIRGISQETGDAVLTASVKRSTLSSKEKNHFRCSNLLINRSALDGSGSTDKTFNDGLTTSDVYGTRVQDEEISLNVPDVSRVLGIFESDSKDDPILPSISVSDATDVFTDNVTRGEQFIGGRSGAVARVVDIQATQLSFVYENENRFEIGENISLKSSGIFAKISGLVTGSRNILNNYVLDSGQRVEYADYSRIIRKSDVEKPTKKLRIIFDYIENIESTGNIETVNSYNGFNYTKDIPFVFDSWASDFLDFRPRVNPYNPDSATQSPFSFASRSFSGSNSETVVSNKSIVVDYSYYQGRMDRLYLTKDGVFTVKQGEPSRIPRLPLPNEEAFPVASLSLPPYIRNASSEVLVKKIPHKRYTMRDIGGLEHRIKNLENYTTLSLLETDTKNLSIKDPNTGLDKFKSGFFVDNFRNHNSHNLTGESKFDIDMERSECRPRSTERNVALMYETVSTQANPITSDYRWVEDFADANISKKGHAVTLDFTEVEFLSQPLATTVENLNPFHIALYAGSIELTPSSDFWIEEVPLGTPDHFQIDGVFDFAANLLGVEDRENGGMASSFWNSHEQTWNGRENATLVGEEVINTQVLSSETNTENLNGDQGSRDITTNTQQLLNTIEQTFEETGIEKTFGLELSANNEVIDLGTKVVGIEVLYNIRSRNIEVYGKRLKPNTRYYVFMENTDLTQYAVPKLLPITMNRGTFAANDIVESSNPAGSATASILFRVASSNHKIGPYNDATTTYTTEPYTNTPLPAVYSSTSSILNVDTGGLAMHTTPDHLGWVRKDMKLVNKDGDAEATVGDLSLISDEKGDLIFSLHIPDPKITSNPKFTTGNNTIRLTTSSTNASQLDPGESATEVEYQASGFLSNTQEQSIGIKMPSVEKKQIGDDQPISRLFQQIREEEETRTNITDTGWYDPLAQSFLVERDKYQDGIFITSGELYFRTKDDNVPVTVQLRTMRDGTPTTTILPFGETQIDPSEVNLSTDGSAATTFKFKTPVYLQSGYEYCIVLIAPTEKYNTYITRMGEIDLLTNSVSNRQPYLGSLFKSQNSSTWDPSQFEDLKFKLNKAKFVTNSASSILLYNNELQPVKILKENPVIGYSKKLNITLNSAQTFNPALVTGEELRQTDSSSGSPIVNTSRILKIAGPITTGTSKLKVVRNSLGQSGVGLTDGLFQNVQISALTGSGSGATANITVNASGDQIGDGDVNIQSGGTGFSVGDLLIANKIGNTGSGVQFVVDSTSGVDLVVIDNAKNHFDSTKDIIHFATNGTQNTIGNGVISGISSDTVSDGYTLKFDHKNHGMHSNTNKVRVSNFHPDGIPTTLTQNIVDGDTTITLATGAGANFNTFEGTAVGAANTGYLLIDKEIIAYESITNDIITIDDAKRGIDSSLKSNHDANALVFKYEFNGVSLLKINKDHDIDPREKTFDSYFIRVSNEVAFNTTKSGGGAAVHVSQNVPFEAIDPRITSLTPTGTSVTGRIKTTSGTSLSGNEGSFTDQGYETISLNKLNYLDTPRIIASKVNEVALLGSQKSFALELSLMTTKEDVSPQIDLDNLNIIAISNLVDSKVSNYETDNRPKVSGSDPNTAIYETKQINLEFISNSLFVQFDGHKEGDADFKVFYKLFRGDGDDSNQTYIPFNVNGSPDKVVNSNTTRNAFSEHKYTVENTAQFRGFMIKVIMISKNQAKPPRLKNFRAIALRSFETDIVGSGVI